tara:strand:+ start:313 stop:570 length:258 start_codon:yes stop_codon:yes gene_type:complete
MSFLVIAHHRIIHISSENRFIMDDWFCGNCKTHNYNNSLHRCENCDEPRGITLAEVSVNLPQNGIGNFIAILLLIVVGFVGYSLL